MRALGIHGRGTTIVVCKAGQRRIWPGYCQVVEHSVIVEEKKTKQKQSKKTVRVEKKKQIVVVEKEEVNCHSKKKKTVIVEKRQENWHSGKKQKFLIEKKDEENCHCQKKTPHKLS